MKSPFSLQGSGVHVTAERPSVRPLAANSFRSPGFQRTVPTQGRQRRPPSVHLQVQDQRAPTEQGSPRTTAAEDNGTSSQHRGKRVPGKLLTVPRGGPHTRASPRSQAWLLGAPGWGLPLTVSTGSQPSGQTPSTARSSSENQ